MNALNLTLLAQTQVGSGVITDGWDFVWGGYALTAAFLSYYALSLWLRRPGRTAVTAKDQP